MKICSLLIIGLGLLSTSCVTRWEPLMNAEIISMDSTDFKKGSYKEGPQVNEKYCFVPGEEKQAISYKEGDATVGLVDEVIMRAQKKTKAKGLKNVSIDHSGSCVRLEATTIM